MAKTRTTKTLRDYGIAIVAATVIALVIRAFLVEAYRIPTPAMHPTLEPGDTIFVMKPPLGFDGKVARGDVVVFDSPADAGRDYIKRVLGVAGDTVQVRKGRVSLNGKALADPAARPDALCAREILPGAGGRAFEACWEAPLIDDFGPEKVPAGSVFVLGDFRGQSPSDLKKRRSWGLVPAGKIKGKARWIWLSIEPVVPGVSPVRFPHFRLERMLRRIE